MDGAAQKQFMAHEFSFLFVKGKMCDFLCQKVTLILYLSHFEVDLYSEQKLYW